MNKFTLACCNLLDKYPLYQHLTIDNNGRKHLRVLILGAGERLYGMIRAVLTNGQLLDTDLEVTVAATYAEHECEMLLQRAPYLSQFMSVTLDHKKRTGPAPWRSLGSIAFESRNLEPNSAQKLMKTYTDCRYVLISADEDEKTRRLASTCARFAGASSVIAYYEKQNNHSDLENTGQGLLVSFGTAENEAFSAQVKTIAYNLHYAYAKTQNDREPESRIFESFMEEYNYSSSMEAALHVKSKLACVGIMDEDPEEAARRFSRLMSQQPELEARLAAVEHRRWCVDKLLAGYGPVSDINQIYQNGATTHDRIEKWHCCLTSCDDAGHSKLTDSDWKIEEADRRWEELDELDRMSIRIHRRCGELARENAPRILSLIHSMQSDISARLELPEEVQAETKELEAAVSRLLQNNNRSISAIQQKIAMIKQLLEKNDSPFAKSILNKLPELEELLAPCMEYVICKDYKKQDMAQIRQIPFALTHKERPILVKLMSDQGLENLYSVWRLEPRTVIFVGYARNPRELKTLDASSAAISNFAAKHFSNENEQLIIRILVPKGMNTDRMNGSNIIHVESTEEGLHGPLAVLLSEVHADYLDITGADYLIARQAEAAAAQANTRVFYVREDHFENVDRAEALAYSAPEKKLTVEEMLRFFGATPDRSETRKLRFLADSYRDLWEVAMSTTKWHSFCTDAWKAYCVTPQHSFAFTDSDSKQHMIKIDISETAAASLVPALEVLRDLGFVTTSLFLNREEAGNCVSVRFGVSQNNEALAAFLENTCRRFLTGDRFEVNGTQTVRLIYRDYSVKDMVIPGNTFIDYRTILTKMENKKLISNVRWERGQDPIRCSFRLSTRDILSCFQLSGRVLEYYLYYSILQDGDFDDVETGYSFFHGEVNNSAENELDIICIKGYSSVFVSAKMVDKLENSYLYEVSYLASRFGFNARAVLAAPRISMFKTDSVSNNLVLTSEAIRARNRNVYLLGTECFQKGRIGAILNNIVIGKQNWWEA